jgi:hypothetical protein
MSLKNKLFAELEGFAIYEPLLMDKYIVDNSIIGNNLLTYLTGSEHGDIITQEGIIIPIIGLPADYYKFKVIDELPDNYLVESKGWILKIESKRINVIGIGYLADIIKISSDNSLSFSIPNGWYELSIISYLDSTDGNQKCFGLKLKKVSGKPIYSGDMQTDYLFE